MLHPSKSQSILQWFNSMVTKAAVESLSQFADGYHFYNIVISLHALGRGEVPSNLADNATNSDSRTNAENKNKSVTDSGISLKDTCTDSSVTEASSTEDVGESDAETEIDVSLSEKEVANVSNKEKNETEVQKRYDEIKAFIDGFFALESSNLIIYSECMKGKDLELAKVAILLLSAMVQSFLSTSNHQVYTTTLLDPQVQEDIKECLSLVLMEHEDGPLRKPDLTRILSRPSKYKDENLDVENFRFEEAAKDLNEKKIEASPRRRTPSRGTSEIVDTPEVPKSLPKKRRERASVVNEEIYESPLKILLESPKIQYKAALFKKDAELTKLRNDLHHEENKVVDLRLEKRSLNDELEKKKRELEFLKEEYRKFRENTEELEAAKREEADKVEEERKKYHQEIQTLKQEVEFEKKENERLSSEIAALEEEKEKLACQSAKVEVKAEEIDDRTNSSSTNDELLTLRLKDDKIRDLRQQVNALEEELKAYKQYDEEYRERTNMLKNSPKVPETVSSIIYADERSARDKLKEKVYECDELRNRLLAERDQSQKMEKLYKAAEKDRLATIDNVRCLQIKLSNVQSDLESFQKQVSIYENWAKSLQKNKTMMNADSDQIGPDTFPSKSSEGSEREKGVKDEPEGVGKLWEATPSGRSIETRRTRTSSGLIASSRDALNAVPSNSNLSCSETEFLAMKKEVCGFIKTIEKRFDASQFPQLHILEEHAKNLSSLKEVCTVFHSIVECLKSVKVVPPIRLPEPTVKRKGKAQAVSVEEIDPHLEFFISQNKTLEAIVDDMKKQRDRTQNEHKAQLDIKAREIKTAEKKAQEMELSIKELNNKVEKLQQDAIEAKNKYEYAKSCLEKLNLENKKLVKALLSKENAAPPAPQVEPCKECKNLIEKLVDIKRDRNDYEKDCSELKVLVREQNSKIAYLQRLYETEKQAKKVLEFRMQRESAFVRGSMSERNAVVGQYFKKGLSESKKIARSNSKAARQNHVEQPHQVVSFNTYILHPDKKESPEENSLSNTFANKSIKSGFFQTDDEEDFLNHSSLAQIHREVFSESDKPVERLQELRRRNTLCLPHLQSSYPVEIQNMTPSERKYFEIEEANRRLFASKADQDLYLKQEAEFLGEELDESEDSHFSLRKRKGSEIEEHSSTNPAKKLMRPSARTRFVQKMKSLTPIRKTGNVSKPKTFKTPQSIRNLIQKRKR